MSQQAVTILSGIILLAVFAAVGRMSRRGRRRRRENRTGDGRTSR